MTRVKPKLGVDLDGCVYSFDYGCRSQLKLRGNDIDVRESNHWNEMAEEVSKSEWEWVWNEGCQAVFETAPEYPGMVSMLKRVQSRVDLIIITHRPLRVANVTLRRLGEAGLTPAAVIHCAGSDKSAIASDCIAYIEDRPENVLDLATVLQVPVFMPRRPYNEEYHAPHFGPLDNIHPYDDPKEIESWLMKHLTS